MNQHSATLQVVFSGLMVLIWIAYLQLFLSSFLRQRRSMILIERGPGAGLRARCFVGNLGLEPIYVLDIVVRLATEDGEVSAVVTDREELHEKEESNPKEATNQGPVKSGDSYDIGSFEDLLRRARRQNDRAIRDEDVRELEVTVVATTAGSSGVVGARRSYGIDLRDGESRLLPTVIAAEQIRSRLGRRRLKRRLAERL